MTGETRVCPTPKGNWVARNLRLLNAQSGELFPRTPAEGKGGKFHSMYKKDYKKYPTEAFLEGLAPKGQQPERETIRDVLFGQSPTAAFANWKIPTRLSQVESGKIGDHAVQQKTDTPKLLRQSTLPPKLSSRASSRGLTPKSRGSTAKTRQLHSAQKDFHRAKTTLDSPSSPLVFQNDAGGVYEKKARTATGSRSASTRKDNAPQTADRRLLQQMLRLQDHSVQQQRDSTRTEVLRGTLQPHARRTVECWLETASEQERQVALQFFNSLAGGRMMGNTGAGQNGRLREVVSALQSPGSRWVAEGGLSPRGGTIQPHNHHHYTDDGDGDRDGRRHRLKHVSLLDDKTRRNRWMHTTWHHLPTHRQTNPVKNWGAHYVTPHQAPHRHYIIHPEWPPQ